MYILTLVLLLSAAPLTPTGPDDETADDEAPKESVQQPASDYAMLPLPARGTFWFQVGYGTVTTLYDQEGNEQDFGQPTLVQTPAGPASATAFGEASTLALHIGGAYAVAQIGDMDLNLGVDVGLARTSASFDRVVVPTPAGPVEQDINEEVSSGFGLQNLTIFGEIEKPSYTFTLGFLADLGAEPDEEDEISNSDQSHALLFGLSGQHQVGTVRLFGGADYFLTLQNTVETANGEAEVNPGDVINLHAGAGVRLASSVELGGALLYRLRTTAGTAGNEIENTDGYNLSLAPYLTYAPVGAPYQISLKGAVQREYYDYGYSITGENDIAPRLGATLTLLYRI